MSVTIPPNSKVLIIAEKPALGKAIADALPGASTPLECGYLQKGQYMITWASGHLFTLKEPEAYDKNYKDWKLEMLPIYFPNWELTPDPAKSRSHTPRERLKTIGKYMKQADCIIHAGDPDAAGQRIVDDILHYHHYKGPVFRIATGDTTKTALQKALHNLRDNTEYTPMGVSDYARAVADFMVGVNMSRYFTLTSGQNKATLPIGRVMTPTLGLVVKRDLIIESHQKQKYYDIEACVSVNGTQVKAKYSPNKMDSILEDGMILNHDQAEKCASLLRNQNLPKVDITSEIVHEAAPLPYNLVKLQSECGSRFGYSPKQVLDITQKLRDRFNAITYNRSDCQYLSEEQFKEAPATVSQVMNNFGLEKPPDLNPHRKSRAFNNANITAHTAIIPTNTQLSLNQLDDDEERRVYRLICIRYLQQFMPPVKKNKKKLHAETLDGGSVSATHSIILERGYMDTFPNNPSDISEANPDSEQSLAMIPDGTYHGSIADAQIKEKETKPPARYTQATLNEDMTRIAKYVDNPKVKKLLLDKDADKKGENGSIGTSATRSGIIMKMIEQGLLTEEGTDKKKYLISTPLGRELFRVLPEELKMPDMTAYWWVILEEISAGKAPHSDLTDSVLQSLERIIQTPYPPIDLSIIPTEYLKEQITNEPIGICPKCGKPIIEGKLGFGCSGYKDGCKFVIWKKSKLATLKKTNITKTDAGKLLKGQKVLKKTLLSKKGTKFSAYLKLKNNPDSPYAEFEFEFINTYEKR